MSLSSAPNVSQIFRADLVISDSLLLESTLYALNAYSRGNCHPPECCYKWCRNLRYHRWHLALTLCSSALPGCCSSFQRQQALGVGQRPAGMLLPLSPSELSAPHSILGLPLLPRQAGWVRVAWVKGGGRATDGVGFLPVFWEVSGRTQHLEQKLFLCCLAALLHVWRCFGTVLLR